MRKCIMALSLVLVGLALILGLGATNRADAQERHEKNGRPCSSIGIVTNFTDNSLYLIDPGTNTLSGPYLKGELGQGNSALNTAVTPGGKTALITNYNAYAVFFVELPHRFGDSPTLPDSVNIGYNAEDVAITPDGKYALITYGGSDPFIAVLDLETRSLRTTYEMPSSMKAAGIEIAADGQTVLAVDHTNTGIHVLTLDVYGNLTFSHSIALTFQPRSIAVSPDGITAVVVNPSDGSPAVLRIDSPGNVVLVEENIPLSCPYGASAAFSSNGTAAFYLSNNGSRTSIHLLEVPAPGIVSSSSTGINVSPGNREGEVRSGFDSFAVDPSGHYAYVWRKASHADNPAGIAVIDLTTQKQVKTVSGVDFPVDITFGCLMTPTTPSKPTSDQPPFGSFETPVNGSTVRSSIAVTGWALDDGGVESVKIYRQQGSDLVYIGDALFIEGARPDVAAAYPNYPNNTRAGWGYMMLTNFLPNGGNGTFKIHATAKDTAGHLVTLGVKTIHCDNANATKPFGAIDSPQPGETISGTNYRITGWVLTPQPNKIPENGSTINVFIDGQKIGHVTYNIYRPDIATLFPGYANSNGAHGYIEFDTTQYSNGVHTLEWVATDNTGNTDGVGSRYFTIQNENVEPFSVGITSPENDGSITVTTSKIGIAGIVTGNPTLSWTLNGQSKVSISYSYGVWNINNIPLSEGKNTIVVIATSGSQQKEDTLLVYRNSDIEFSGPLSVSEDMVEVGDAADVDFFVGIAEGTSNLNKMELVAVDQNGTVTGVLTEMKDDGETPDDIPNDNIYACRINVLENTAAPYYYQARASTDGSTGWSGIATVTVFIPLTDQDIQEEVDLSANAVEHANSQDELVTWLNQQSGITNIDKTVYHVSWTSQNDVLHTALFGGDGDEEVDGGKKRNINVINKGASTGKSRVPGIKRHSMGQDKYYHYYYKSGLLKKQFDSSDKNQIGSNKVLIWAPYYWENKKDISYNFEDTVYQLFKGHDEDFEIKYWKDPEASVESVKNWSNYGVICIHTHGINAYNGVLSTYTEATVTHIKEYSKDIRAKRLCIVSSSNKNDTIRLGVTPAFIKRYCGAFPNSFIYLGACHSFEGNFPSQFLKKGAGAVIGYTNSVYKKYNKKVADTITEELLEGETVSEALAEAKKQHGNYDRGWLDELFNGKKAYASCSPGNSDIVIMVEGLTNGDFETGDRRGWDPQGDVRVLSLIGPIKRPQGNYMAILSTGLGAVNESTSILEQTFNVPNDAKKLTFKYNWVSEEPREWINMGFNDQMEISWIPESGSSITIVAKNIDDTTWIPSGYTGLGNLFRDGDETAFETGWKSVSYNVSAYKGKKVTLRFKVWDVGDSLWDSACFVDQAEVK